MKEGRCQSEALKCRPRIVKDSLSHFTVLVEVLFSPKDVNVHGNLSLAMLMKSFLISTVKNLL